MIATSKLITHAQATDHVLDDHESRLRALESRFDLLRLAERLCWADRQLDRVVTGDEDVAEPVRAARREIALALAMLAGTEAR